MGTYTAACAGFIRKFVGKQGNCLYKSGCRTCGCLAGQVTLLMVNYKDRSTCPLFGVHVCGLRYVSYPRGKLVVKHAVSHTGTVLGLPHFVDVVLFIRRFCTRR